MRLGISSAILYCACACTPLSITPPATLPNAPAASQVVALPAPRLAGTLSLEATLAQRRSTREFSDEALTLAEIGQLLWAAQGVTSSTGQRTAPSAGGLYPLEIYLVTRENVFHYEPPAHYLLVQRQGDARSALWSAALQQDAVKNAPAIFVIAGVYARTALKYGDRAARYVQLEAGHAAQNILLQAGALKLGAVPIGAFDDEQVKQTLALPAEQQPLYLISVGHSK